MWVWPSDRVYKGSGWLAGKSDWLWLSGGVLLGWRWMAGHEAVELNAFPVYSYIEEQWLHATALEFMMLTISFEKLKLGSV